MDRESDTCESDELCTDPDFVQTPGKECKNFSQFELNDLVRDLGLSKESAEVLASRLKEKNLL